jgi:acetyl-CoA C-acetyltransferase
MTQMPMRRVAVLGGMRIPFCRSHTAYAELSNLDMLTAALCGLADRFGLAGAHIDEVVGGAVITHAKDWNLAREAVIGSSLARTTPGITMMQACGTSLQAALGLAAKIATGLGYDERCAHRFPEEVRQAPGQGLARQKPGPACRGV